MIVKFHSRGKGGGSGPVDYLLGKDRDREGAEVLRGDPENIRELIDSNHFAQRYTSGVLSFSEADLKPGAKDQIMDSFQQALFPGLDRDQYSVLWVEHTDKGRLELNFLIPNVELTSGKRLQPYYDRADRPRVNAWQTLTNAKHDLTDPHEPERKQALTLAKNLPPEKQKASEAITAGLMSLAGAGEIKNRDDVIHALEGAGFTIARETKSSISIADPSGGRNIRLKGKIYERSFKFGAELRSEIEAASQQYRATAPERVRETLEFYREGIAIKREQDKKRYPRPTATHERLSPQKLALDRINPDFRPSSRSRDSDVHRDHDRQRLKTDPAEQANIERAGGTDIRPEADSGSRGPVYRASERHENRERLDSQRATGFEINHGVTSNDGTRKNVIDRIRELAARTRSTMQRFEQNVRDYFSRKSTIESPSQQLERASDELKRSSQGFEQTLEKNRMKQPKLESKSREFTL